VASKVSLEQIAIALAGVNYPGYQTDIVSLGMVEEVTPAADGGYAITLRSGTDREEILRDLAARIHQALKHELGVPKVEFKVSQTGEIQSTIRRGRRFADSVATIADRHSVASAARFGHV